MAGKNHLVLEHLENVNAAMFERYSEVMTHYLDKRNGIYALYRGPELYYVGLARNLKGRLKDHMRDRHAGKWDHFSIYLTQGDRFLKDMESLILRISLPEGNRVKGRLPGSTDLKRSLDGELISLHRTERNGLLGRSTIPERSARNKNKRTNRSIILRRDYKGRTYWARLRADGSVRIADKEYASVTGAAKSIVKRAINGWLFWNAKNEEGEWVTLSSFR